MILVDAPERIALNADRGSVLVITETGNARCTTCGERIPKNTRAIFAWDQKRAAQRSRLHTEGQGTTELRHVGCSAAPSTAGTNRAAQPDPGVSRDGAVVPPVTGYKQTSREAYVAVLAGLTATQKVILALYDEHGPMTDEELYDRYGALEPTAYRNTVLPARNALYNDHLVVDTGKRRAVRSGRSAIVWDSISQEG